jgi:flagellar hook assembly protein FlgD
VFNTLGQKVKTLASGRPAGGRYTVMWDGTDSGGNKVSSGSYYCRLIAGSFISSKKMILLK